MEWHPSTKMASVDNTVRANTGGNSKHRQTKRLPVRSRRKPNARSAAVSPAFNFVPEVDLNALGSPPQSTGVMLEPMDAQPEGAEAAPEMLLPTWCPMCGFNCAQQEEHQERHQQQQRSIVRAADKKNIWLVQEILSERKKVVDGANGDATEDEQWQREVQLALMIAVHHKSVVLTRMLLDAGVQPNLIVIDTAAMTGHVGILELLDGHGVNWDQPNSTVKRTPLHVTADWGHQEASEFLIAKGCDVNITDSRGVTPLHLAAKNSKPATLEKLLASGADATIADSSRLVPWMYAVNSDNGEALKLLFPSEATQEQKTDALLMACRSGAVKCARYLISIGAKPGWDASKSTSALLSALNSSTFNVIHFLVKEHADALDINVKDPSGLTAIQHMLEDGSFIALRPELSDLAKAGADVNLRCANGKPILLEYMSCAEKARWLLDAGSDPNAVAEDGMTAFHAAVLAWKRNSDFKSSAIAALFARNIDLALSTLEYEDVTPVVLALDKNYPLLARYLLDRGCSAKGVRSWLQNKFNSAVQRYDDWEGMELYLKNIVNKPQTLQEACRWSILNKLGRAGRHSNAVGDLPIPHLLHTFLMPERFAEWKAQEVLCN